MQKYIVILSLFTLFLVLVGNMIFYNFYKVQKIIFDDQNEYINPGKNCRQLIDLGDYQGDITLEIWFEDVDSSLKEFVNIKLGCDNYLSSPISLDCLKDNPQIISFQLSGQAFIEYELSSNASNEMQNMKLNFITNVKVKR